MDKTLIAKRISTYLKESQNYSVENSELAADKFASFLAEIIVDTVSSATITIPPNSIVVAGAGPSGVILSNNTSPIVVNKGLK